VRYVDAAHLAVTNDRVEIWRDLRMRATFLFGGHKRSDPTTKVRLFHGDVVVWGGDDRLRYHRVMPL
jgi:alkylated DNA repair protein (DNA oxidative demethylase)